MIDPSGTHRIQLDDDENDDRAVPTLTVVYHHDFAQVGARADVPELDQPGRPVSLSRHEPGFFAPHASSGRPLGSPFISRQPVRLMRDGSVLVVSCDDTTTTVSVDGEPVTGSARVPVAALEQGVVLELSASVVLLVHRQRPDRQARPPQHGLIGHSDAIVGLRTQIEQVARGTAPVLIRGETGSGKELVARAIHQASTRQARPYIVVNMAAIPATLAASELFGHTAGAYSGARGDHQGYFSRADGGTLFLDEIGDAPSDVQVLLLRALETGEVQQVGAERLRKVDVRFLAATDMDLDAAVADGRFRAPLLYRIANHELRLPPLRARREDVGRLLFHFLREELGALGRTDLMTVQDPRGRHWLAADAVGRLVRYAWPGNVRQLRNVARWIASAGVSAGRVRTHDPELERLIPEATAISTPPTELPAVTPTRRTSVRSPSEIPADELLSTLEAVGWGLGPAASRLGISRPALNELVDNHPDLRRAKSLGAEELIACQRDCDGNVELMWRRLRVSKRSLVLRMSELGLIDPKM